jgi:hypothetical protein
MRVLLLTLSVLLPTSCDAGSGRPGGFFQQMVGGDAADVRTFFQQHFERLPMLKRFSDRCALERLPLTVRPSAREHAAYCLGAVGGGGMVVGAPRGMAVVHALCLPTTSAQASPDPQTLSDTLGLSRHCGQLVDCPRGSLRQA